MKFRSIAAALLGTLMIFPIAVHAGQALDTVKTNVGSVIEILRDPALKGDKGIKVKQEKLRVAADNLFDFVELSKRTLGAQWNSFSPEQRKQFVSLYRALLEKTYEDKIMSYSSQKITFTKEVPLSENTFEVYSLIAVNNNDAALNYRVMNRGASWKVYDVVIEGVSLVGNYRTQFRQSLADGGPQKLLDILNEKAKK